MDGLDEGSSKNFLLTWTLRELEFWYFRIPDVPKIHHDTIWGATQIGTWLTS